MHYRHEWKHEINALDRLVLLSRLGAVMKPDPHAAGGSYQVRSLYFDTPEDTALREKIDGVDPREKFRLRYYNGDPSFLVLEKKSKLGGLCAKQSCRLRLEEARRILDGGLPPLADAEIIRVWEKPQGRGSLSKKKLFFFLFKKKKKKI